MALLGENGGMLQPGRDEALWSACTAAASVVLSTQIICEREWCMNMSGGTLLELASPCFYSARPCARRAPALVILCLCLVAILALCYHWWGGNVASSPGIVTEIALTHGS
ncbi:unnamed protein product [Ostreobium quekettii]|uniref:Uncharacterized protein n=1 Tax=Ostreobium quekettii TaxID=121088 RepID=A0A8S1INL4_9CHLO|nr:unnamed protein product [Ostreobium quekettii]